MNYQWYPGHMTKAIRQMKEDIQLIDLIIELVDARIPLSSRNPDIDELGRGKARMVLLNKSDLSDPLENDRWLAFFESKGIGALLINSKSGAGLKSIAGMVDKVCAKKKERDLKRGIKNRPVRAMVVGIPNVGKSTFINSLTGRAVTRTGNKPGVTKGKQWIKLTKGIELLDTPGILWPKFEDNAIGMKLAFIGSMNDEILIPEELAIDLTKHLEERYPESILSFYKIEEEVERDYNILEAIARSRNCLAGRGELDIVKASKMLMDDFRAGRLGRITLETVED